MNKGFQETQLAFIDHLKDPEQNHFDHGIEDRRMKIYRELFFNNVAGFLSSGFPVLESLYSKEDWLALARRFFADHECRSPYFVDISKEFVEYLSNEYRPSQIDPPFLSELAHYEWLELAISIKKPEQEIHYWNGDSPYSAVSLSELATLVCYQYPVHQIRPDFQPSEPGEPVYIVVFRDDEEDVQFTLVNAVTAHLLNLLQQDSSIAIERLLEAMSQALPQLPKEQVEQGTKDTKTQQTSQTANKSALHYFTVGAISSIPISKECVCLSHNRCIRISHDERSDV